MISGKNSHWYTHGMAHTRFNTIWKHIKSRCLNLNDNNFKIYGGRGIKCLWKSFEEFRDDMFESYSLHVEEFGEKNTSIDRIDNNGNYCKENCKWSTHTEQMRNRSNVRTYQHKGKPMFLVDLAEISGLKQLTIRRRLFHGASVEEALDKHLKVNQFR
jgi:hypothetical protein